MINSQLEPNDTFDLIFFSLIFLVILFLFLPGLIDNFPRPYNCSRHNSASDGCVAAQQAGKGCAWHAGCQLCFQEGAKILDSCQLQ